MPAPVRKAAPPPPPAPARCGLAVSLADLGRAVPAVRAALLKGRADLTAPVLPDPGRPLDAYVEFTCDLATAAAAVDVFRDHDRAAGDRPLRAVVRTPAGAWTPVPPTAVLSLLIDGRPVPNPDVFKPEVRAADLVAPPVRAVRM